MASSTADVGSGDGFEVGFPGPSLDNPLLFAEYARRIEERIRAAYPPEAGYVVEARPADDPRKREWRIRLRRGWLSGAVICIAPLASAPHRARVKVEWDSRLLGALILAGMLLAAPFGLVLLVLLLLFVRLLGALVVTGLAAVVWMLGLSLVAYAVARLVARVVGDEFDGQKRREIAGDLRNVALPLSAP